MLEILQSVTDRIVPTAVSRLAIESVVGPSDVPIPTTARYPVVITYTDSWLLKLVIEK